MCVCSAHILSDDEEEDVVPTVFRWEHGGRQVRESHANYLFPLQVRQRLNGVDSVLLTRLHVVIALCLSVFDAHECYVFIN